MPIGFVEEPPKKKQIRTLSVAGSLRSFTIEVDAKTGIDGRIVPGESKVNVYHTPKVVDAATTVSSSKILGNALIRELTRTAPVEGEEKVVAVAEKWAVTLEVPQARSPA